MDTPHPVFDRSDTFLGACEAVGQEFGFDPLLLRVALGVSLLWNPVASVLAYAILGVAVLASRLLFPVGRREANAAAPAPREGDNDVVPAITALAA